jgi:UDP-N-acetylmuramoyl-L-alanyl-D-glutamate--2,6-diaminopimelate ligase
MEASFLIEKIDEHVVESNIVKNFTIKNVFVGSQSVFENDLEGSALCCSIKWLESNISKVNNLGQKILLMVEEKSTLLNGKNFVVVKKLNRILGKICNDIYYYPSQKLDVVGITGTNGKTTIASFINQIWKFKDYKTLLFGTISINMNGVETPARHTTPDVATLNRYMFDAFNRGVGNCVLEVSSHGLDQNRSDGICFGVGIFSNISQDHLDYHKNMEDYFQSKLKLFDGKSTKQAVVFLDNGEYSKRVVERCVEESIDIIGYTVNGIKMAKVTRYLEARIINKTINSILTEITYIDDGDEVFRGESTLNFAGNHNVENVLAAVAALIALNEKIEDIVLELPRLKPPLGRTEVVDVGQDFSVLVDYAHTPGALESLISSTKVDGSNQIVVFGCGGDRDISKRPLMGSIVFNNADIGILTDDNPRGEDPQRIRKQALGDFTVNEKTIFNIGDRRKAIEKAVEIAQSGDIVIIAGKGHEKGQEISGKIYDFNDVDVAGELISKKIDSKICEVKS